MKEKNIFAFSNQKGGVGKTTTVINVGASLGLLGFSVLIIDIDPQGNTTSGFGIDKTGLEFTSYNLFFDDTDIEKAIVKNASKNVDIIGANADLAAAEIELIDMEQREFLLKKKVEKIRYRYDFIFIDCPPSLGLLTINALVCADRLIIPMQCEYYSLEGLGQLVDTHNLIKSRLNPALELYGVVLTMADFRTNLTEQVVDEVKAYFKDKVFESIIPRAIKLSEAPGFGKPAVVYAPGSKGCYSYQLLAEELLERLDIPYNYIED